MKILYQDFITEIKNTVQTKAKYQKVMLLYDENVSELQTMEIRSAVKEICIFNQMKITDLDYMEIYNGYKLVIYLCRVDSFLRLDIHREDFDNLYIPQDENLLPYFLDDKENMSDYSDYLVICDANIDIAMMSSVNFNKFYNYFKEILSFQNRDIEFSFENEEITQYNSLKLMTNLPSNMEFIDIRILKEQDIEYKYLPIVDLLLINAFLLLITSIKNHDLTLVDVYKGAKDDDNLLDRLYSMCNNDAFYNIITLNYNCLYHAVQKTKQKILSYINSDGISNQQIEEIVTKVKNFTKNSSNFMCSLYLHNIFSV
ncbi:MAG: hypothetical protein E7351_00395 [Clostridiales bacterium]|nr:hypothetical protein [Clostridiales bacterium]